MKLFPDDFPDNDDEDDLTTCGNPPWSVAEVLTVLVLMVLMIIGMACATSCSTNPASHYAGPSLSVSAGYAGATAAITVGGTTSK